MDKVQVTNISTENFGGEQDFIELVFRINGVEFFHAYVDAEGEIDLDSLDCGDYDRDSIVEQLEQYLQLEETKAKISGIICDSVFGSNDLKESEQLFGAWLNSWGVFKFVGTDGECGVAVCHANDSALRIDRKAKTFQSNDEYQLWFDKMIGDDHHGDAIVVSRAIDDIEQNSIF